MPQSRFVLEAGLFFVVYSYCARRSARIKPSIVLVLPGSLLVAGKLLIFLSPLRAYAMLSLTRTTEAAGRSILKPLSVTVTG